jgi:hypothetical protein
MFYDSSELLKFTNIAYWPTPTPKCVLPIHQSKHHPEQNCHLEQNHRLLPIQPNTPH